MKKEAGAKNPGNVIKRWSFLEASKQILDEEKMQNNAKEKGAFKAPMNRALKSSDNMVEAEPDIHQMIKPKV